VPGPGAQEPVDGAAEQAGGGAGGEGDAALQVEGEGALGEAFEVVGRGQAGLHGVVGGVDRHDARPVGQSGRFGGVVQQAGGATGAGDDVAVLAGGDPARPSGGPHEHDAAPASPHAGQRCRGQGERVGQCGGGPGVAAGHLGLALDPHETVVVDRVGDRDGRGQRQPLPGGAELQREAAQRHQAQDGFAVLDEVETADRRTRAAHGVGQGRPEGVVQRPGTCGRLVAPGHGVLPLLPGRYASRAS
jgi:hypothetical protein